MSFQCFFTHFSFYVICGIFIQYIYEWFIFFSLLPVSVLSDLWSSFLSTGLLRLAKVSFFTGTFTHHTTDILIKIWNYTVHGTVPSLFNDFPLPKSVIRFPFCFPWSFELESYLNFIWSSIHGSLFFRFMVSSGFISRIWCLESLFRKSVILIQEFCEFPTPFCYFKRMFGMLRYCFGGLYLLCMKFVFDC